MIVFWFNQGLTSTSEPVKSNPFAGFSGLTKTTTAPTPSVPSFNRSGPPSTYQEAIEVLNKEFFTFVKEQLQKNSASNWINAVQVH